MNNTRVKGIWKIIFIIFSITGVAFAVNHIFQINPTGQVIFSTRYLFILVVCYLPLNFLMVPATRKATKEYVPWYDVLFFLLTMFVCAYFIYYSLELTVLAWNVTGGPFATFMSLMFLLLTIEAMRRRGNQIFLIFSVFIGLYPLYANKLPKVLAGQNYSFLEMVRHYVMGDSGLLGIPVRIFGDLVIGFILFGILLEVTGAAKFFMDFATSFFGKSRGGAGKIACMVSGLFGTMNGDPISNVLTTGPIVLPVMKKSGYSNIESAGLLTCAASGGVLAPPVMGVVAFIMAALVGQSYLTVAISAAIPAMLYYLSLIVQMDFIAGRKGLTGVDKSEIPNLRDYIKTDWIYIVAFGVLIYYMVVARIENQAPFYASFALIIGTFFYRKKRMGITDFIKLFEKIGKLMSYLIAMIMTVGLILGAFFITGMGPLLARSIMNFAGGNLYILLILTAALCYLLGMGMPITAAYIFLAIIVAPMLETLGLNIIASHLFILYWGLFSFMTPPVALAAFTAAALVDENPIKVGFKAMSFAVILYFIPFFFVLNPVMILRGELSVTSVAIVVITSIVGVILIAGGLQGYMFFLGSIPKGINGILIRLLLIAGGFLLVVPFVMYSLIGLLLSSIGLTLLAVNKKRSLLKIG